MDRQDGEGIPKNDVTLFFGGTRTAQETEPSVAVAYERVLTPLVGIQAEVEATRNRGEVLLLLPGIVLHPGGGFYALLSPGLELANETLPLLRIGAGWEFELGGGVTLAPEVNYDFVSGEENSLVAGLTFGYRF